MILINSFYLTLYVLFHAVHDFTTSFLKILNSHPSTVFRSRANSSIAYDVMFSYDVTPAAFRYSALLDCALDECRADTKRFYKFAVYMSMRF